VSKNSASLGQQNTTDKITTSAPRKRNRIYRHIRCKFNTLKVSGKTVSVVEAYRRQEVLKP